MSQDQHRERLLEGLAESIRENGLASTQISDIVRNARASRRTFYNCFADKETCFVELAEIMTSRALEQVDASIDRTAPWSQQIDHAIDTYLGILTAEPAMTVTFSSDLPTLGARGVAVQRDGVERYAELLVNLVQSEAMRDAGVALLSIDKAVMLVGGLHEMIVRAVLRGQDLETLAPVAKDVMAAVLRP